MFALLSRSRHRTSLVLSLSLWKSVYNVPHGRLKPRSSRVDDHVVEIADDLRRNLAPSRSIPRPFVARSAVRSYGDWSRSTTNSTFIIMDHLSWLSKLMILHANGGFNLSRGTRGCVPRRQVWWNCNFMQAYTCTRPETKPRREQLWGSCFIINANGDQLSMTPQCARAWLL